MIAETQVQSITLRHPDIMAALENASAKTGSDFSYLLNTAMRESGLDSQAKSKASSASGLFQFVDQTWLGLMKRFGDRYGLGAYAGAIEDTGNGHYAVASADTKAAILALRQDPQLSALMAGEAAQQTKQSLECALGRQVCDGELYAAHFLGQGGAKQIIQLRQENPQARADLAFPQAAKANPGAFYHADGTPKTVDELYAWATNIPGGADTAASARLAAATTTPSSASAQMSDMELTTISQSVDKPARRLSVIAQLTAPSVNLYAKPVSAWGSNISSDATALGGMPQPPLALDAGMLEMLAQMMPSGSRFARAA